MTMSALPAHTNELLSFCVIFAIACISTACHVDEACNKHTCHTEYTGPQRECFYIRSDRTLIICIGKMLPALLKSALLKQQPRL